MNKIINFEKMGVVMRPISFSFFYRMLCVAIMFVSASVLSPSSWGIDVQYVYNSAGHLVQVVDTDGTSAEYQYDASGNVINVINSPMDVALVTFSPVRGVVGSTVTLAGNNFITTPAQNTVQFNGVNATVVSATANTLVVIVPVGATTGTISVTNANGTVTSATSFTVLTALTITGFSPSSGAAGTNVTLSGTGFDPTMSGDIVQFNGHGATVTSASTTQVQATVPAATSTGPISVTTSMGSAVSANNFLVPPGSLSAGSITSVITPPVGGSSQVITQSTANTYALLLIPGGDNNLYSLQFSNLSLTGSTSVSYTLYTPNNTVVTLNYPPISSTNLSLHLPKLLLNGYYSLVLTAGAGTGSYSVALEAASTINSNGTPFSGMVPITYQSKRYTFIGGVGQKLGLGTTNVEVPGASAGTATVVYAVYDPNGININSTGYCWSDNTGSCSFNLNINQSGTYSVVVTPGGTNANCASGSHCTFDVLVTPDKIGTLTPGTLGNLSIDSYGQNLRYTFAGTQGQSLALEVTNIVANPSNSPIAVSITRPNGSVLISAAVFNASNGAIKLPTLPDSGTYTLFAEPTTHTAATAIFNLLLDTGISIPVNGTMTSGSISQPLPAGRYFTFSGTASQNLGVGITNVVTPGALAGNGFVYYTVYDPSGNTIGSGSCYDNDMGTCAANLVNLPVTTSLPTVGYYGILVTPGMGTGGNCSNGSPCTFKVTVSLDKTGTLTVGAAADTYTSAVPGQNARYAFTTTSYSGTKNHTLKITNYSYGSLGVTFTVKNTNTGAQIATTTLTTNGNLSLPSLSPSTSYTVIADPTGNNTGSFEWQVTQP